MPGIPHLLRRIGSDDAAAPVALGQPGAGTAVGFQTLGATCCPGWAYRTVRIDLRGIIDGLGGCKHLPRSYHPGSRRAQRAAHRWDFRARDTCVYRRITHGARLCAGPPRRNSHSGRAATPFLEKEQRASTNGLNDHKSVLPVRYWHLADVAFTALECPLLGGKRT